MYDALVGSGSSYSNVIFDSSLDGQAIEIYRSTSSVNPTRSLSVIGNGRGTTILNGAITPSNSQSTTVVRDLETTKPIVSTGNVNIINCYIHDTNDEYRCTGTAESGCQVGIDVDGLLSGSTFTRLGTVRTAIKDYSYTQGQVAKGDSNNYYCCIQNTNADPTITFSNTDYWKPVRYRANWSSTTANYVTDDLVVYSNAYYICKVASPTGTLPTDTTYWTAVSGSPVIGMVWGSINIRGTTSSIDNCVFDSIGWTSNDSAYKIAVWSYAISVTNCKFLNNVRGYDQFNRASTVSNCLFYGNNSVNYSEGYALLNGGSSSANPTVTITGCTFATTTDHIKVSSGRSIVFADTNIINSTVSGAGTVVFADGATVKSTLGSGEISSIIAPYETVTLENITISGVTSTAAGSDGLLKAANANARLTLSNCEITGNTLSNGGYALFCDYSNSKGRIDNVVIRDNRGVSVRHNTIYQKRGIWFINNFTSTGNIAGYLTTTVFYGDSSFRTFEFTDSSGTNWKIIFTPDSIVRVTDTSITARALSMFYVGTYDEDTNTITTAGTATVVLNGTTVSISGSGTTIDANGLHS